MGLTPASYNVPRTITHRAQLTNGNVTADFYALQGQVSNFTATMRGVMEMPGVIFMHSTLATYTFHLHIAPPLGATKNFPSRIALRQRENVEVIGTGTQ